MEPTEQSDHDGVSAKDKLLCLINESENNGMLRGRKKLMKLAFFAEYLDIESDRLDVETQLDAFDFTIFKYGPFSRELMRAFDQLKREGLVSESNTHYGYRIKLSDEGRSTADSSCSELPTEYIDQIRSVADKFKELNGSELEDKSLEYLHLDKDEKGEYMSMPVAIVIEDRVRSPAST